MAVAEAGCSAEDSFRESWAAADATVVAVLQCLQLLQSAADAVQLVVELIHHAVVAAADCFHESAVQSVVVAVADAMLAQLLVQLQQLQLLALHLLLHQLQLVVDVKVLHAAVAVAE